MKIDDLNIRHKEIVKKAKDILYKKGYRIINECSGPENTGSNIEFWAGEKGTLILQIWNKDLAGTTSYLSWSSGHTFEDLEKSL